MKNRVLFLLITCFSITAYAQNIVTIAGGATGHGGYWGEGGSATDAQLTIFGGVAVDTFGNVYIAQPQRVCKVDAITGIITTIAGNGVIGYNGDSIIATNAKLNGSTLVAVDLKGDVYIADGGNYRIRKVNMATGIITTFAGNGILGDGGDGGLATFADCDFEAFTFDVYGNMIIESHLGHRIRMVDTFGIITTIAGNGITGNSGDGGPATAATVTPDAIGITTDKFGNIYFSDSFQSIRKIDYQTGIISREGGTGDFNGYPYLGDGGLAINAHLNCSGLGTDINGNIYIADYANSRIEKIDTFGIIHSIVGTGVHGYGGDNGPASAAQINYPENVVVDKCGNLYIADFNNARVRKVIFDSTCFTSRVAAKVSNPITTQCLIISPNPAHNLISIQTTQQLQQIAITNYLGQRVITTNPNGETRMELDIGNLPKGVYFVCAEGIGGDRVVGRFVKE